MGVANNSKKEGTSTCMYCNSGNFYVEIFSWPKPTALLDSHKQMNEQKFREKFSWFGPMTKNILTRKFLELRYDLKLRHIQYREYCIITKMESL